MPVAEQ